MRETYKTVCLCIYLWLFLFNLRNIKDSHFNIFLLLICRSNFSNPSCTSQEDYHDCVVCHPIYFSQYLLYLDKMWFCRTLVLALTLEVAYGNILRLMLEPRSVNCMFVEAKKGISIDVKILVSLKIYIE